MHKDFNTAFDVVVEREPRRTETDYLRDKTEASKRAIVDTVTRARADKLKTHHALSNTDDGRKDIYLMGKAVEDIVWTINDPMTGRCGLCGTTVEKAQSQQEPGSVASLSLHHRSGCRSMKAVEKEKNSKSIRTIDYYFKTAMTEPAYTTTAEMTGSVAPMHDVHTQ